MPTINLAQNINGIQIEAPIEMAAISVELTRPAIMVSANPIEFCAICANKIGKEI